MGRVRRHAKRLERLTMIAALAWFAALVILSIAVPDVDLPQAAPPTLWLGALVTVGGAALIVLCCVAWALVAWRSSGEPAGGVELRGQLLVRTEPPKSALARGVPALLSFLLGIGLMIGSGAFLSQFDTGDVDVTAPAGIASLGRLAWASLAVGMLLFCLSMVIALGWATVTILSRLTQAR